jgi:hypothetical protein
MSIHRSDEPKQHPGFSEQIGGVVNISRTCDCCSKRMFSGFNYVRHVVYRVVCTECMEKKKLKPSATKKRKNSQGVGL